MPIHATQPLSVPGDTPGAVPRPEETPPRPPDETPVRIVDLPPNAPPPTIPVPGPENA